MKKEQIDIKLYLVRCYYILQMKQEQNDIKLYMVRYYIFCNRSKRKGLSIYIYGQILYILQWKQEQRNIKLFMVRYYIFFKRNKSKMISNSIYNQKLYILKRSKSKMISNYICQIIYILRMKQEQNDIKLYMVRYYIFCNRTKSKMISNYIWSDTTYSAIEARGKDYQTIYTVYMVRYYYILQTKQEQNDIRLYIHCLATTVFCNQRKNK